MLNHIYLPNTGLESQVDQTDFFNVGMGRDIKYKPYRKLFDFIDWLVFGLIDLLLGEKVLCT